MKVSHADFSALVAALSDLDTPELRSLYRIELACGRVKAKDPEKFFRWYLFNRASDRGFRFSTQYRDAWIDTALRNAVDPVMEEAG